MVIIWIKDQIANLFLGNTGTNINTKVSNA